jgi:lactoylglutathione lyase
MNFCWCTINVKDVEKSIKFYTEMVGLKLDRRYSPRPGMELVFLDDENGNEIELIKPLGEILQSDKENISIGFKVDSMDEAIKLAKSKDIDIVEGPFIMPNIKFFFVRDPDGFRIQIIEKI